jgi:hypothetical protein
MEITMMLPLLPRMMMLPLLLLLTMMAMALLLHLMPVLLGHHHPNQWNLRMMFPPLLNQMPPMMHQSKNRK